MVTWAASCQAAVTAIRKAGATAHKILLPGTGYTSAESFVSSGSAAALSKVTNLDGSTDNLIYDVHKYLDSDNSGTHAECVSNDISTAFQPLASYLTKNKRIALLSETGGGSNDKSCLKNVCDVADFLNQHSDAYLGILGWAAGSFDPETYVLSMTPVQSGTTWKDQPLLTKCIAGKFSGGNGTTPPSSGGSSSMPAAGGSSMPSNPSGTAQPSPTTYSYAPASPTDGSGDGSAPISYGGSMSWGSSNTTVAATGTGGVTGISTPYHQPTTFATSTLPASSTPPSQLTGPGNNDGAGVWGSKSQKHQAGQGSQLTDGTPVDDGEDDDSCEVEYV